MAPRLHMSRLEGVPRAGTLGQQRPPLDPGVISEDRGGEITRGISWGDGMGWDGVGWGGMGWGGMGYGIWDNYGISTAGRRRREEGCHGGLSRRTVTDRCHDGGKGYCHGGLAILFWGPFWASLSISCPGESLLRSRAQHFVPSLVGASKPSAPTASCQRRLSRGPPQKGNQASRDGQENAENVVCRELWFMSHRIKLSSSSAPLRKLPPPHPSKK